MITWQSIPQNATITPEMNTLKSYCEDDNFEIDYVCRGVLELEDGTEIYCQLGLIVIRYCEEDAELIKIVSYREIEE